MEVEITQKVNVPLGPWCGKCNRQELDKNDMKYCSIFNRFLYSHQGNWLKCRECYLNLYVQIEQGD